MKISKLKTNASKEAEGVWVPICDDAQVKVARIPNPKYDEYLRTISKPHVRAIRLQTVDSATLTDLFNKAMAKHVLLDWKGITEEDGSDIPYSEAKALELLQTVPDLRAVVMESAQDASLFRDEIKVDAIKN